MKKRIISILLTLVMLIGMTSISAFAEGSPVSYLDADGTLKTANNVTEIDTPRDTLSDDGWYLLKGNMEFTNGLELIGNVNVNLILADGAMITVTNGILLSGTKKTNLTIYAQSTGESMGTLVANGKVSSAGIGSGNNGECGAITINGGNITAQGGAYSAGIGSGDDGKCGAITINGGIIKATGDDAGIGSGCNGSCGAITINGGNITAQGDKGAAGIGSGLGASCGAITIRGGNIKATGSGNAAGIGSGSGRTSGWEASCGVITISGGNITAQGGYCNPAIGSGSWFSVCGDIIISGGIVTASAGDKSVAIGSGELNSKCGNITISGDYVRAKGAEGFAHIGAGIDSSCGNIDYTSCKHWEEDGWYYVTNHELTSAVQVNCEEAGYREYYKYLFDNKYYAALPFTDATCIGDDAALATWLSEGGKGYIAPLGHKDDNADKVCDNCGQIYYSYYDYDPATGQMSEKYRFASAINSTTNTLTKGWYAVKGNVEIAGSLTINGDVHLILADGSALTVKKGVILTESNSLAIYVQSFENRMGRMTATGNLAGGQIYSAGIGGYSGADGKYASGKLTINGGSITSTGGLYSAGIGGSSTTDCGEVTINAGVITAIGGSDAAGIGGGENGSLTKLTINGDAVVTARGNGYGAGIGGGVNGNGGEVKINSGVAMVYGGENAAAFGKDSQVSLGYSMAAYEIVDKPLSYDPSRTKEVLGDKLDINAAVGTCKKMMIQKVIPSDGPEDPVPTYPDISHEHLGILQSGVTPTRNTAGYKDFYICSCGKFFEDQFSKTEITDLNAWVSVGGRGYLAPLGYGGSESSYTVTVNESVHGSISADKKSAYSGSTVTLTAAPEKGWTVETITVLDKNGKSVEIKNLGGNKYSFRMPSGAVTVSATFMEDNTMLNFCVDVKASDYYYDAVLWAYLNGITDGVDNVRFGPNETVTRGQVVTFLWRAAGQPEPANLSSFSDVSADAYYAKAVAWAVENGITDGVGGGKFAPSKTCTRAEIVTFLWRYAGSPVVDYWMRMEDVPSGQYYTEAVRWALSEKITDGTSKTTFSPNDDCTRAQVVTFLYRRMVK